jgi:hypothetical protein
MLAELRGVFADPMYRYERRRIWTTRRQAGLLVLLALWWALAYYLVYQLGWWGGSFEVAEVAYVLLAVSIVGRAVLCLSAAMGAAFSIVDERTSGQLDQIILTPISPRRYFLARGLARLRGFGFAWTFCGFALVGGVIYAWAADPAAMSWTALIGPLVVVVIAQVDLAFSLVTDVAVGMRFSCTGRNGVEAALKTILLDFVGIPVATWQYPLMMSEEFARIGPGTGAMLLVVSFMFVRMIGSGLLAWGMFGDTLKTAQDFFYPGEMKEMPGGRGRRFGRPLRRPGPWARRRR